MTLTRLALPAALLAGLALAGYLLLGAERSSEGVTTPAPGEPIVAVAMPAELSSEAEMGRTAFAARCAECHGPDAGGRQGIGPPLVHKIYEPGHHGDMSFVLAAQNGVRGHHWNFGDMPPVEGITRAEVATIVAYVRALQRENGIP